MPETVGFIGTGLLGTPICERLVTAGHRVLVWNRTPAKAAKLIEAGAVAAASPAALAREAAVVFACVTDAAAVEAVALGLDGVAAAGRNPEGVFVDLSSVAPAATRDIALRFTADCGRAWVDSPVSGGAKAARAGRLIAMLGGDPVAVERVMPLIAAFAVHATHMGEIGAGQATKLCNQLIIGATLAGVAEAIDLARRCGIDAARLPDALAGGWADSAVLQSHGKRILAHDLSLSQNTAIMQKDLDGALALAGETGAALPVTALVAALYRLATAQGHRRKGQLAPAFLYPENPGTGDAS